MIKRILVPLDPSPYTDAAIEFAAVLGKCYNAELAGLVVLDVPGIERSVGAIPVGGLYYAEMRIAGEEKRAEGRIHQLLEKFKTKCDQLGVRHCESERQGSPSASILLESRFYDCLAVGLRTYFGYRTDAGGDLVYGTADDHSGDSLAELMNHSAVPVFSVPLGWQNPARKQNVLIAFDGSVPAVRALHSFARLFEGADAAVTLLMSHPNAKETRYLLEQAALYLRAYGFSDVEIEWTPVSIRQAMAETYSARADLVALGAHSKSALIEFMVGSVCRDLISSATKPLLIAH